MPPTLEQRLAARTPDPDRKPVMRQRWEDLLFAHWRVPEPSLRDRLPPGLHIDTFEGEAFVGVVPFAMRKVRPVWAPAFPWLSNFLELNVRTYVHDDAGVPGVWFFSLDANQPVAVTVARRWFHLNYRHATMKLETRLDDTGEHNRYRCQRRGHERVAEFEYAPAGDNAQEAGPGTLEFFLLERYYLYAHHRRREKLYRGQVVHTPYRFELAPHAVTSSVPLSWEGIEVAGEPCHVAVAHPVDVEAYSLMTP